MRGEATRSVRSFEEVGNCGNRLRRNLRRWFVKPMIGGVKRARRTSDTISTPLIVLSRKF